MSGSCDKLYSWKNFKNCFSEIEPANARWGEAVKNPECWAKALFCRLRAPIINFKLRSITSQVIKINLTEVARQSWRLEFSWKVAHVCNWIVLWTHFLPVEFGGFNAFFHFLCSLTLSVLADSVSADIKSSRTLWVSCTCHSCTEALPEVYPR